MISTEASSGDGIDSKSKQIVREREIEREGEGELNEQGMYTHRKQTKTDLTTVKLAKFKMRYISIPINK